MHLLSQPNERDKSHFKINNLAFLRRIHRFLKTEIPLDFQTDL